MTFGDALEQMKAGKRMRRSMWIFRDVVYVRYTSAMQEYLVVQSGTADAVPYTPCCYDIFADDWQVVK